MNPSFNEQIFPSPLALCEIEVPLYLASANNKELPWNRELQSHGYQLVLCLQTSQR